MRRQNSITPYMRELVTLWLAGQRGTQFTVVDIVSQLVRELPSLSAVDCTKAVSNELIRREQVGTLDSRKGRAGEGKGVGRPPRVYWKVYCNHSLNILRKRLTPL